MLFLVEHLSTAAYHAIQKISALPEHVLGILL